MHVGSLKIDAPFSGGMHQARDSWTVPIWPPVSGLRLP